jgi:hypothetical protein
MLLLRLANAGFEFFAVLLKVFIHNWRKFYNGKERSYLRGQGKDSV